MLSRRETNTNLRSFVSGTIPGPSAFTALLPQPPQVILFSYYAEEMKIKREEVTLPNLHRYKTGLR